jgi:plastocyanin
MRAVVRILFLVPLLAACGDAGNPSPATTASDDSAAASAQAPAEPAAPFGWMPTPEDTSRRAGSIGDPAKAHQVMASVREWSIEVEPDTIPAGEVTIAFENKGERPHAVEVRNERAGRWRSTPIPPGGTVTMTMPMAPAAYDVVSTTDAYVERGMRATLIVR